MTPREKMMVKSYAQSTSRQVVDRKFNASYKKNLDSMPRLENYKRIQMTEESSIESKL